MQDGQSLSHLPLKQKQRFASGDAGSNPSPAAHWPGSLGKSFKSSEPSLSQMEKHVLYHMGIVVKIKGLCESQVERCLLNPLLKSLSFSKHLKPSAFSLP